MNLKDYLHANDMKCAHLARELGVTGHYLRTIRLGRVKPSEALATKIELLTGGAVTIKELRG